MSRSRSIAALAVAAVVLLTPAAASAHVTINPAEVEKGGFAKLAFRTPNERDDAGTVKLEVNLPPDAPFAFFNVRPVPGWKSSVERTTLAEPIEVFGETITEAVSKVTWEGGTIPPGSFEEFEVSVGPMPEDVDELVFKALQTYSSGEIVRWIEVPEPGATEEPEHPAPVLKLVRAEPDDAPADLSAQLASTAGALEDDVDSANRLAAIAIAIAAIAVIASIAALVRKRSAQVN